MNTGNIVKTAFFAALTSIGAYMVFPLPFSPVPVTMQTVFVLLSGYLLGMKLGPISQLIYLMIGAAGFPVFSKGTGGMAVLAGPTGGYLLGFIIASFLAAMFRYRKRRTAGLLLAQLSVYIPGLIQLKMVTGLDFSKTIVMGFLPFLPGDIFKVIAASSIIKAFDKQGLITEDSNDSN
jgi:biotin transport system substrate-specific component